MNVCICGYRTKLHWRFVQHKRDAIRRWNFGKTNLAIHYKVK